MLGMKVTHLLELPEGRKTVPLGVDEKVEEEKEKEEESGGEASRVASKSGKKERGTTTFASLVFQIRIK